MSELKLVIGNKNYSSWSLRPWLLLRHHRLRFEEICLPLYTAEYTTRIAALSPSGKVPVLHHGDFAIWDSLAICEYVSEQLLDGRGWPADPRARAVARAASAEMHAGFQGVRTNLPMNLRGRFLWRSPGPEVEAEIARIVGLWTDCRARFGALGPWLFGEFSIADAMYVPVALRFATYNTPLEGAAADYVQTCLDDEHVRAWRGGACQETESLPQYEARELWEPMGGGSAC